MQLTSESIIDNLGKLSRQLDSLVEEIWRAEQEAVLLRQQFEVAEAKAFLTAEGAVESRKRLAKIETEEIETEALIAEAKLRYMKNRFRALEQRIEVGRTYSATVRAELKTLPGVES